MESALPAWPPERLDALNRLTTVAKLLSTAVHETGNALQVISGHAEMLDSRPDDPPKTRVRARTIKLHADQAGGRLRTLVALATAQPGPPRKLDLRSIANRAVDLRRYSLGRAQIAVTVDSDRETVPVMGDEFVLIRIIANLLLHIEEGVRGVRGAAIKLVIAVNPPSTSLMISRNGPPLAADAAAKLFEPFSDPNDPGPGLAVAKWLATQQGGTLYLDDNATEETLVLTLFGSS